MSVLILLLLACEQTDPCLGRGDMSGSPGGIAVTAREHGPGWGQDQCFVCHQLATLHKAGCADAVDVAAIDELADPADPATCASCHGSNGVHWLEPDTGHSH